MIALVKVNMVDSITGQSLYFSRIAKQFQCFLPIITVDPSPKRFKVKKMTENVHQ